MYKAHPSEDRIRVKLLSNCGLLLILVFNWFPIFKIFKLCHGTALLGIEHYCAEVNVYMCVIIDHVRVFLVECFSVFIKSSTFETLKLQHFIVGLHMKN